jgi:hypothetical protein
MFRSFNLSRNTWFSINKILALIVAGIILFHSILILSIIAISIGVSKVFELSEGADSVKSGLIVSIELLEPVGELTFSPQLSEASEFKFSKEGDVNNLCRSSISISGDRSGLIKFCLLFDW